MIESPKQFITFITILFALFGISFMYTDYKNQTTNLCKSISEDLEPVFNELNMIGGRIICSRDMCISDTGD